MGRTGNPVLSAFVSSARFAARRAAMRFSSEPEIETLIMDVDRTITREDSPKLALESLCGKEESSRITHAIIKKAMAGKIPLASINAEVFGEIYSRGFSRADWATVMEGQEKCGGLRIGLVEAVLSLAAREGFTVVLATRSSVDTARWIARRFGIRYAVGSEEAPMNGKFAGFRTIMGVTDVIIGQAEMVTKMTAASRALASDGRILDPKKTAVLSNDLLDAFEMLDSARGVLLVPQKKNTLEKLTSFFGLYDALVFEGGDIHSQLESALGTSP